MRQLSKKEILNHASEIAEQGYSIMEEVIDNKFRIQVLDELERLESVRPGGDIPPGPFTGFVTRRWFDLLNDDPTDYKLGYQYVDECFGINLNFERSFY